MLPVDLFSGSAGEFSMPMDQHREWNRANWDERVAIHWASDDYDIQSFIDDPSKISQTVELDSVDGELGDVSGRSLIHLQCHFGHDTLSMARKGARVTGVDFSEEAIKTAKKLSIDSGTSGEFHVAEVYDSPQILEGQQFDIVYTGVGAICWLPDVRDWAKVVADLVKPCGTFSYAKVTR